MALYENDGSYRPALIAFGKPWVVWLYIDSDTFLLRGGRTSQHLKPPAPPAAVSVGILGAAEAALPAAIIALGRQLAAEGPEEQTDNYTWVGATGYIGEFEGKYAPIPSHYLRSLAPLLNRRPTSEGARLTSAPIPEDSRNQTGRSTPPPTVLPAASRSMSDAQAVEKVAPMKNWDSHLRPLIGVLSSLRTAHPGVGCDISLWEIDGVERPALVVFGKARVVWLYIDSMSFMLRGGRSNAYFQPSAAPAAVHVGRVGVSEPEMPAKIVALARQLTFGHELQLNDEYSWVDAVRYIQQFEGQFTLSPGITRTCSNPS
jgi:hypothetical protein